MQGSVAGNGAGVGVGSGPEQELHDTLTTHRIVQWCGTAVIRRVDLRSALKKRRDGGGIACQCRQVQRRIATRGSFASQQPEPGKGY